MSSASLCPLCLALPPSAPSCMDELHLCSSRAPPQPWRPLPFSSHGSEPHFPCRRAATSANRGQRLPSPSSASPSRREWMAPRKSTQPAPFLPAPSSPFYYAASPSPKPLRAHSSGSPAPSLFIFLAVSLPPRLLLVPSILFPLVRQRGAPTRSAAMASKFSAQQCRFKKNSSHEIPSVSLALTRFAQRLRAVVETRASRQCQSSRTRVRYKTGRVHHVLAQLKSNPVQVD
ncbi:uncharacterized protein [Zea mays]|uniref:uncharacterized protein n=1 Tax=Zea mays TaxID=4577 RepID=UPI0009AADBF2|nr:uncharacterized protein LOC109941064 [Zea mays]|eukprot:XP_020397131.1 uncharacterized protein LOC109941064 [Zea mays]